MSGLSRWWVGSGLHLQADSGLPNPVSALRIQVVEHLLPVLDRFPLRHHLRQRQIQQFQGGFLGGERASSFDDFAQAHVQRLDRIGRVHHLADFPRKLEKRSYMVPVISPQSPDSRITGPFGLEST